DLLLTTVTSTPSLHDALPIFAGFTVSDVLAKPIETAALLDALRRAGVAADRRGAVLVVDDDPGCLRLMEATLGRSGFQTICRQEDRKSTRLNSSHGSISYAVF